MIGKGEIMKIDRLMAITNYLLHNGRTSAQKLSQEFEVSVRTIMRDIDTLAQAHIPIQSTCGVDGGYDIIDTYTIDKQIVNKQDYEYIITALCGLQSAYTNKSVKQTINKMLPLYDKKIDSVLLDFSVASEKCEVNSQMKLLEDAIRQKRVVQFQYTNNDNIENLLKVEPVRLEFKWYNWYLIAYYQKHQNYCMFKLVRMNNLEILDITNTINHNPQEVVIRDERKVIQVTLRGNAKIKSKCREYLNGEVTKEYLNGDFEFRLSVPENENYWYGVILSFGNNVTVLEPQSVIGNILATCNEIKKKYEE